MAALAFQLGLVGWAVRRLGLGVLPRQLGDIEGELLQLGQLALLHELRLRWPHGSDGIGTVLAPHVLDYVEAIVAFVNRWLLSALLSSVVEAVCSEQPAHLHRRQLLRILLVLQLACVHVQDRCGRGCFLPACRALRRSVSSLEPRRLAHLSFLVFAFLRRRVDALEVLDHPLGKGGLAEELLQVAQHDVAQLVLHGLVAVHEAVDVVFVRPSVVELREVRRAHCLLLPASGGFLGLGPLGLQVGDLEGLLLVARVGLDQLLELLRLCRDR